MELSREEIRRYARQIALPGFGEGGQKKLKSARVLVVGAGGLGSPLLLYLTAAGVGTIGIVDFDTVEESNLHRQILYTPGDIGKSKAETAVSRLRDMNPFITLKSYSVRLDRSNINDIIGNFDVVADGTDNFATRYLVNDACVLSGKTNVFASVFRFELQVSVFIPDRGPCYRCIFPDPPNEDSVLNCAEGGILGVIPGIAGSLQGAEIIKIIGGTGEPLTGKLLVYNVLSNESRMISFSKDPACPVCGSTPSILELQDYDFICSSGALNEGTGINEISAQFLLEKLRKNEKIFLVDVREPDEFNEFNINGLLIPLGKLRENHQKIPRDIPVIIYCRSGRRSRQAIEILQKNYGFQNLLNLKGGILAWKDAGYVI